MVVVVVMGVWDELPWRTDAFLRALYFSIQWPRITAPLVRAQITTTMSEAEGDNAESSQESSRKGKRKTRGSQTDDECSVSTEANMAEALAEINRKLDIALARIQDIEEIKEKQQVLEKENADLKASLEFAHTTIKSLTEQVDAQQKSLSQLTESVSELAKTSRLEKERAIKLESHSRRNNLIFYNIPEERHESSATSETLVYNFLEQNLNMEEEVSEISIERAHRLGKMRDDQKPRPIIAKFSFHKDKERILSKARLLAGTTYGISQDFPPEIVEVRKELIKVMKDAKKNGQNTKLIYDKLYIDGQRYRPGK